MLSTQNYELVRLVNGTRSIRSTREGETFHPVIGPAAEAEALYVNQLDLPGRMKRSGAAGFVIWDVGLGAAANVLTVLRHTRETGCPLRLISFDHTLEPLEFALAHADELGYFGGYESIVAALLKDRKISFRDGDGTVEWEVCVGDFPAFMRQLAPDALPAPHAVLFDAYSPARNPEMWTLEIFSGLNRRMCADRPCQLPTYSRSTLLRVTLLLSGFFVGVGHATGEKDETTIAANVPELIAEPLGMSWLNRVRKSTSAEPMHEPVYRQRPLSPESLRQLLAHPQFRGAESIVPAR